MIKLITGILFFSLSFTLGAQETSEEKQLRETIEIFFEGFHQRDSLLIKSVTGDDIVMQSIGKDESGKTVLHQEDFNSFLKSIVSIPLETSFREELHSFEIRREEDMANVWTPYSLFINDIFSHCGVNNFQLMKKNGNWQIIYIVDTRRKEGCDIKE